jgi:single-stranded DNA-binding protein
VFRRARFAVIIEGCLWYGCPNHGNHRVAANTWYWADKMAADNHTTIVGNLVDDPELRFTNTGIAVANLRVAVTQRIQQDGQWRDGDTSFLRVNVWRGQAEHLADSLSKGDRVMVTSRLRQRSWETPRATSGRWPRSRPMRSAPPSSGPRPRSSGAASAATATASKGESGRPNVAATSTTRHRLIECG